MTNPGATDGQYIEIDRFVTSYQVSFGWESDLTAVRPLLTGAQTLRVFIDTWVGPGDENGNGWLYSAGAGVRGCSSSPVDHPGNGWRTRAAV